MKKFVALLLAAIMVLGCTAAFAKEDGKITIWTWDPTFNIAAMNTAKEMYQKDHPDVEIEVIEKLSDDVEQAVIASSGNPDALPDIFLHQDNSFQKFLANYPGIYVDLTDKYDYEGFAEGKLAYSTKDGKHYGIPFDAGTCVGAWRTDYLEQAGYTIADLTDITWERFLEIGKDVKAKTGYPMLSGQLDSPDIIMEMLQSAGSSMFNEDGSLNIKDNAVLHEAIKVYAELVSSGVLLGVNSWDQYIGTLSQGSVVGTINGCWILATVISLKDQSGKWDITNIPSLPNVEGATNYSNNGGSSWAIVAGNDSDLAIDFMSEYRNPEFYATILPTTSAIATFAPAKDTEPYKAPHEFFNGRAIFETILDYTGKVPGNITGAYYYNARNAVGTAITNVLNGGDLDAELATAEETVAFDMDT